MGEFSQFKKKKNSDASMENSELKQNKKPVLEAAVTSNFQAHQSTCKIVG